MAERLHGIGVDGAPGVPAHREDGDEQRDHQRPEEVEHREPGVVGESFQPALRGEGIARPLLQP